MENTLGWEEYAVFVAMLIGSAAIGVFYGCFGKGQKTTKDYLQAGGDMSSFPVALSLLCSMISSIALLGYPVEIYLYGTQYMVAVFCYIPLGLSLAYLYIPVFFNLKVSSAYEFIEIRFHPGLRVLVSAFSIVHIITLMSIAVYAPSLAIELVTGISSRISTAVICFVCIFYSTLGGLKAVLWADVLQGLIMIISLATIAIKGATQIGSLSVIWERVELTGRVQFFNFDPDPRTRHTVWTCLIGGYFVWLPTYASTQLQVQRFLSLPTISRARRAILMNFIAFGLLLLLCCFTGMVMIAKYYTCDPIKSRLVSRSDQIVPFFAEQTVLEVPGLLGLFLSGLTCASMSTLSSGLTALASVTTYDYIKKFYPKLSDTKLSFISKINTLILGIISYAFIFVVEQMGSILPAVTSLSGLLIGPTLGLFTLGMMFPPATTKGGLFGMVTTIMIMCPYTILQYIYRTDLTDQRIPLSTQECPSTPTNDTLLTSSTTTVNPIEFYKSDWKNRDDSMGIRLLSLSYMWHSALTCCLTVFFGVTFSLIHRRLSKHEGKRLINPRCISPPVFHLWSKLFPNYMNQIMDKSKKEVL